MHWNQKMWGWCMLAVLATALLTASLATPLRAGSGQEKDLEARLKAVEEKLQALEQNLDKLGQQGAGRRIGPKTLTLQIPKLDFEGRKAFGFEYKDGEWRQFGEETLSPEERQKLDKYLEELKKQSKEWDKDGLYRFEFRSGTDETPSQRLFFGPDSLDLKLDTKSFIVPRIFMGPGGMKKFRFEEDLTKEERSQFESLKKTKEWQKLSPKLKERIQRGLDSPWGGLRGFWFEADDKAGTSKRKV